MDPKEQASAEIFHLTHRLLVVCCEATREDVAIVALMGAVAQILATMSRARGAAEPDAAARTWAVSVLARLLDSKITRAWSDPKTPPD